MYVCMYVCMYVKASKVCFSYSHCSSMASGVVFHSVCPLAREHFSLSATAHDCQTGLFRFRKSANQTLTLPLTFSSTTTERTRGISYCFFSLDGFGKTWQGRHTIIPFPFLVRNPEKSRALIGCRPVQFLTMRPARQHYNFELFRFQIRQNLW